jgi:hypothetical protein
VLTAFGMGLLFPTAAVAATSGVAPGDRGLLAAAQQVGIPVSTVSRSRPAIRSPVRDNSKKRYVPASRCETRAQEPLRG